MKTHPPDPNGVVLFLRFNEVPAFEPGKLSRATISASSADRASMRSRHLSRENIHKGFSYLQRFLPGFNEVPAFEPGKRAQSAGVVPAPARFNEVPAFEPGKQNGPATKAKNPAMLQ